MKVEGWEGDQRPLERDFQIKERQDGVKELKHSQGSSTRQGG